MNILNDKFIREQNQKMREEALAQRPITITNSEEIHKDPDSANIVLAVLADALGISTNTYGPYKKQAVAHK